MALTSCPTCETLNKESSDRCEACDTMLKPDARPARRKQKVSFVTKPAKKPMSMFASVFWGVTLAGYVLLISTYLFMAVRLQMAADRMQESLGAMGN